MSAYLDEQTPHLRSLHDQLSLPAEVLQADLARIDAAIKGVITSIIREREAQVDTLKDEIAQNKRDVSSLARAVGDKGRDIVALSRRESFDNDTLPKQLERLTNQMDQLRLIYDERLQHIQKQQLTLDQLAALLGPPFQPSKPLQSVASSSKRPSTSGSAPVGEVKKRTSTHTLAQQIAGGKVPDTWYDVGESISEELDEAVSKALEERKSRRKNLCQTLFNLIWLHSELALPPVPTSSPHHFPPELLPAHEEEETPGACSSYERLLNRVIASNPLPPGEVEEWGEVEDLEGMENVQPEIGLIEWSDELTELWNTRKEEHEARIQELYNLVEPLWSRLEVDQDTMDLFVDMNRGSGESVIKAYEAEYERLLELRRSSLSSFIENTRKEIDVLQTELMLSDDERAEFGAFIDDDYTEELLHLHEEEIERLREEVESKSALLPRVREWHTLVRDEEELERSANDPNRFKMRGGAMLKEEKMRKRVTLLKPKIETELLSMLPQWEETNGRPFLVSGERVITKIEEEKEAKEAAKEAKKRAKQGLAPAKILPSRHTPAPANRSAMSLKRAAPTPTPATQQNKRARGIPGSAVSSNGYRNGSSIRPMHKAIRSVSASVSTTYSQSHSHNSRGAGGGGAVSPTPFMGGNRRIMSHSSSLYSNTNSKIPSLTMTNGGAPGTKGGSLMMGLSKDQGRKPKPRMSFKPRPSVFPSMAIEGNSWGLIEEDEDIF
ncbi:uncharacterized protein I303_102950 [Kwoniella dejecticola CBS 10117]|uniref:Protein regulator of cytokinesis 1 n=1 Tax=Kwoniella dejecticola CBS 10117 TaxID=1296121 RepID=A0A1A6AA64_9TREE|nr:uncharacterized protein I303_02969 [Kwoniella dejecticola CBS 10117]OBR86947.1 hypothetical protein I303_02969 [Kwoniella dejecticola CBS 10117]